MISQNIQPSSSVKLDLLIVSELKIQNINDWFSVIVSEIGVTCNVTVHVEDSFGHGAVSRASL